jgi:guanine deaminase
MVAVSNREPSAAQSGAALSAATTGGAHAIRRDDLGQIKAGAKADLVLVDLTDPSYIPLNSATRQLVYTEGGRGVKTVMIDGKVVIQDGELLSMDEKALIEQIKHVIPQFQKDYAEIKARVDGMRPYLDEAHRRIWAEDVGIDRIYHDMQHAAAPRF